MYALGRVEVPDAPYMNVFAIQTFADALCARRTPVREAVKLVPLWNARLRAAVRQLEHQEWDALVDEKEGDPDAESRQACSHPGRMRVNGLKFR